jgi:hypothetical protein
MLPPGFAKMKQSANASAPKVALHFWDRSDAFSLNESIVECGQPDPLFRTML